jgi:hypothetical protein
MRLDAGVTLIEVVVAVTLLSLLTVGMAMAIRVGLAAYSKTESKLMENRRIAGAQRILQAELEGLTPVFVACSATPTSPGVRAALFQGEPSMMWLASTFSLQQGWRGRPQLLELFVIPGEDGMGVRLVVNEIPYTGARGAGLYCPTLATSPTTGSRIPQFMPMDAGPNSFVLADKLALCRFAYYTPNRQADLPPSWETEWTGRGWPLAVRVEMVPLSPDPSKLQSITVTAPLHIRRDPDVKYEDKYKGAGE